MDIKNIANRPRYWIIAALIVTLGMLPAIQHGSAQSVYSVMPGDTLTAIAAEYGVSVEMLAQVNQIANPDLIIVGQRLAIPASAPPPAPIPASTETPAPQAPGTGGGTPGYHVQSGDTLTGIAAQFGVTVQALVSANGISNPDLIVVGQALVIPGSTAVTSPPPQTPAEPVTKVSREEVRAMLYEAAEIHGEDPYLMMALAWRESGWQQHVVSSSGALGVMQLMPATADWAGPALVGREIDPANNVWDNIETGVAFYAHLYSLSGSDYLALAGYYQGPYSVETQGLFSETEDYVENVLDMWDEFAAGELP